MQQSTTMLQREQMELWALDKNLEKLLPILQDARNTLKVEELHLKSSITQAPIMPKKDSNEKSSQNHAASNEPSTTQINKQEINLNMFVASIKNQYDDDDDDSE